MSEDPRFGWADAGPLAFTLVGLVLVFMALGYLADRWVGTRPWLMICGVFVGAGLGFAYLVSSLFSRSSGGRGGDNGAEKAEDQKQVEGMGVEGHPDRRRFWR
jgi:F0F1-type ATP synthase assembly protein I